jgi:proline iminopeptidase
LIADIEALREHLGVERWLLEGLSWGSALAIAYAQAYPERVSALALFAVCVGSAREIAWTTEGMRRILPREWEALARSVELQPGERLIDACYRRVTDPDPQNRAAAGTAWCAWEDAHMQLAPNGGQPLAEADPRFQLVFATLVTHYWAHAGFFGDPGLLGHVDRISHVPAVLIHGRLDVSLPVESAWRLHKQWPASELIVVEDEGHGGPRMIAELLAAIDRLGHVV